MLDLSVLSTFDPVSLSSTKNSSGDGISFESQLDPFLKSGSLDADKLAKIIEKEAAKSKDEAKKLELIERSLAYVRAKGGSDLSSDVYEQLKDKDSSDLFGPADEVPSSVQSNIAAKTAWEKIMTGRAYDHIEENKNSIQQDLDSARDEADDKKILKVAANPALVNLKEELMGNGMSSTEADRDISRMLRETKDSKGKSLLAKDESVEIEMDSPSSALSAGRTKKLEEFRDELTAKIDKATSPEAAKKILEDSVDDFEKLRPSGIKPEMFYTEQMQAVLDESKKYKDYHVAANPSLEKITVDGKELIKTTNDKVYVNSDGKFVNSKGKEYEVKDDKITVGDTKIDIEDIKPSQPEISVVMHKDQDKVEDRSLEVGKEYMKDQRLVHQARGDEKAVEKLDKELKNLGEIQEALPERRKKEKNEGKSDNNNTLTLLLGILGAAATVAAALSQGRGTTTTVTGGCGYNGQAGYGYGSYYASDKYGYNRGDAATYAAAQERHNQYRSTFLNNPVKKRSDFLRAAGMSLIQGQDGGPGVYGLKIKWPEEIRPRKC
jgi:uncharacterized protein YoaH (UPF0181 family)